MIVKVNVFSDLHRNKLTKTPEYLALPAFSLKSPVKENKFTEWIVFIVLVKILNNTRARFIINFFFRNNKIIFKKDVICIR